MGSSLGLDSPELKTVMLVDAMAERYGLLPSEVLARANTLDAYIMDASISYQNYLERKSQNQAQDYSQEELMSMMERTRGQH